MTLHPIIPLPDAENAGVTGKIGTLATLPITSLRVDDIYQRAISEGSVKNIRRICKDFDWAKFLPVIVVPEGELFSVVDGQHRATAALSLGITEVPCYILTCSAAEAAGAFAAINGNTTRVSPVDIWFAELAAGLNGAPEVQAVFDAAGVSITRKRDGLKPGETQSVKPLRRYFQTYGAGVLTTALQCITETGEGNPGCIVGFTVHAIIKAIITKPELMNEPSRLFDIFDEIDLPLMIHDARIENARSKNPLQFILTRKFNEEFRRAEKRLPTLRSVS